MNGFGVVIFDSKSSNKFNPYNKMQHGNKLITGAQIIDDQS